jgi:hypothetical protein
VPRRVPRSPPPPEICAEAVALFAGRRITTRTLQALMALDPQRQVEAAAHLAAHNNFSRNGIMPMLLTTRPDELATHNRQRWGKVIAAEWAAALKDRPPGFVDALEEAERSAGAVFLELLAVRCYIETLLGNPRLTDRMAQRHPQAARIFREMVLPSTRAGDRCRPAPRARRPG